MGAEIVIPEATTLKSGIKSTVMPQGLFQRGRASSPDLSDITRPNSGTKLTQMTQALFQRGRASVTDFRTAIGADEESLDVEFSRKSTSSESMSNNSGVKLAPATQALFQRGRTPATDSSSIAATGQKHSSEPKLTPMAQGLFQRGRAAATDSRETSVTDKEWLETEISRRSKIAETARQKRITDRAWLEEEMSGGLSLTKATKEAVAKLARMKRSVTS